jgi:hypothetical protein
MIIDKPGHYHVDGGNIVLKTLDEVVIETSSDVESVSDLVNTGIPRIGHKSKVIYHGTVLTPNIAKLAVCLGKVVFDGKLVNTLTSSNMEITNPVADMTLFGKKIVLANVAELPSVECAYLKIKNLTTGVYVEGSTISCTMLKILSPVKSVCSRATYIDVVGDEGFIVRAGDCHQLIYKSQHIQMYGKASNIIATISDGAIFRGVQCDVMEIICETDFTINKSTFVGCHIGKLVIRSNHKLTISAMFTKDVLIYAASLHLSCPRIDKLVATVKYFTCSSKIDVKIMELNITGLMQYIDTSLFRSLTSVRLNANYPIIAGKFNAKKIKIV